MHAVMNVHVMYTDVFMMYIIYDTVDLQQLM